jgi:putative endonuclease
MSGLKKELGQAGENLAVEHLQQRGYTIVARNWRCKQGEIDIIAGLGETLIFVEVRTRRSEDTEASFASITPQKAARMSKLAYAYVDEHKLIALNWRIDVIAIAIPYRGTPVIDHVEDALQW